MNNMDIYERSRSVPKDAQKAFNNGKFNGIDINPMWRIKRLTEEFGACGLGWYTDVTKCDTLCVDDEILTFVELKLYVKYGDEWSKPIFGTGGNKIRTKTKYGVSTSDEGFKMAYTDALGVACKALGIGADIYYASDKTKYTNPLGKEEEPPTPEPQPEPKAEEKPVENAPKKQKVLATQAQRNVILMLPKDNPIRMDSVKYFGAGLETMTASQAIQLINRIKEQQDESKAD